MSIHPWAKRDEQTKTKQRNILVRIVNVIENLNIIKYIVYTRTQVVILIVLKKIVSIITNKNKQMNE